MISWFYRKLDANGLQGKTHTATAGKNCYASRIAAAYPDNKRTSGTLTATAMQSKATTVQEYLQELPPERREAISAVRDVILKNLDPDFEEGMQYGMIGYYVPHRIYPAGYHCDPRVPLPFACLASQKNYMSLHLMSIYGDTDHADWFHREWAKTGKRLDAGKACIRFKRLADLPLDVIGRAVARVKVKNYIAACEAQIKNRPTRKKV
jgi:hypothetical protein